ncbi:MAG: sugar ABC transporter permease [Synergistaceae bacterium]|jgi:putative multiple sugar transport system permease protein|nr:sugar ABC transporter permease [Synergistaceae bacterium]
MRHESHRKGESGMSDVSMKGKGLGSLGAGLRQYGMGVALIVIFLVFSALSGGKNFTPMNINNLVMQNSYVVILAVGMLLCIITGNVDLSVGSVVAFTGAISATLILNMKLPIAAAVPAVLLLGLVIGMWQGIFIAFLKVPPFIVTLANMLLFRGLTMLVLRGQTKGPLPGGYTLIGAGYLPTWPVSVGGTSFDMFSAAAGILASLLVILGEVRSIRSRKKYNFAVPSLPATLAKLGVIVFLINFFTLRLAVYQGLPFVLSVMLGLILLYTFFTNRMVIGRYVYAVGGNIKAAALSGIKTQKVMFWVYANMGLLSALAGIVLSARNASATPKAGDGFELDAIASCYIGGASAYGGTGTVTGAVIGALIMGILNNGMSLIGWSVDMQRVVKGLVLLGAVTIDLLNRKKKR